MKKLVVILLATLVATSAFALVDQDPNSFGVYFDAEGDGSCITVGAYQAFDVYYIVANPTTTETQFYEFGYEFRGVDAASLLRQASYPFNGELPEEANIKDIGAASSTTVLGDHIVASAIPLASRPAFIVHRETLVFFIAPPAVDVYIFQSSQPSIPGTELPMITAEGNIDFLECSLSTGGPGSVVARINPTDECVVSVEESSFGSVKSLFR